jgi:hypothetical protein
VVLAVAKTGGTGGYILRRSGRRRGGNTSGGLDELPKHLASERLLKWRRRCHSGGLWLFLFLPDCSNAMFMACMESTDEAVDMREEHARSVWFARELYFQMQRVVALLACLVAQRALQGKHDANERWIVHVGIDRVPPSRGVEVFIELEIVVLVVIVGHGLGALVRRLGRSSSSSSTP